MKLNRWIVVILIAGLLPSMPGLIPGLPFTGPINLFKLALPVLFYFLWKNRREVDGRLLRWLGLAIAIGTAGTLIAAARCGFPANVIREWGVICIGLLSGVAVFLLTPRQRSRVALGWAAILYGACLVDVLLPSVTDWLYLNVLDPKTRIWDNLEMGQRALTGIFGRQSAAKLLALMPWVLLLFLPARKRSFWLIGILFSVSTAAILGTGQRGPFVAALVAIVVFALYHAIRLGNRKVLWMCAGSVLAVSVMVVTFVPSNIWETRLRSLLGLTHPEATTQASGADYNRALRIRLFDFSLQQIASSPLGNACVPEEEFDAAKIHPTHSHHLILEQFRMRGWVWGMLHLFLWLAAFIGPWLSRSRRAATVMSAVTVVLVSGLFDHPWAVLNHAIILGVILVAGLQEAGASFPTLRTSKEPQRGSGGAVTP